MEVHQNKLAKVVLIQEPWIILLILSFLFAWFNFLQSNQLKKFLCWIEKKIRTRITSIITNQWIQPSNLKIEDFPGENFQNSPFFFSFFKFSTFIL